MVAYCWRENGSVAIAVRSIEPGQEWTLEFAVPPSERERVGKMLATMLPIGEIPPAEE
jgi:hypothetical protein